MVIWVVFFTPTKMITAAQGGAVVTSNKLASHIKNKDQIGNKKKYWWR